MNASTVIRLVAGREISSRLRSRGWLLTTGLLLLAVIAGGVVLNFALGSSSATRVAVTPQTAALSAPLTAIANASKVDTVTMPVADDAAGEAAVRDEKVDAALTGTESEFTVVVRTELDPALGSALSFLQQQVALAGAVTDLGGDPQVVSQQLASQTLQVRALDPSPERDGAQIVAGYIAGILLFIALQISAQQVAQGVVEEKSSRVVELLLSTIRPWQLMAGKVMGIGVVGLLQVATVVAGAAGTALSLGLVETSSIDLGATMLWALVFFVVGFLMYSLAFAALASLVSRQEDVASVTAPVMMAMIIPYVIAISIAPWDPNNSLVAVLSYTPFAAPLVMPMRIALGVVETWQVLVSLALSVALIPGLVWLAARIYSNAVMRTGARVRIKDAVGRS
ncbi:MAG: ABC transporter permease [Ornithinimicrobium sp.]|uniref:ABC transporter permease n=1 Tax=Ornithinimicrobium sp. TaxID=1977084 RepID=UPI0026E0DB50|nr:ABC transporter permease [Ornithinimicrobium sp.]MDO5739943.1 ABC transporter permease [Ornithinimicrobium sp.]